MLCLSGLELYSRWVPLTLVGGECSPPLLHPCIIIILGLRVIGPNHFLQSPSVEQGHHETTRVRYDGGTYIGAEMKFQSESGPT